MIESFIYKSIKNRAKGAIELNIRESIELHEQECLSKYASVSKNSVGRKIYEKPCEIRTDYQRDRDRIIHCKSFRRLKHKTQVFISPKGDHYRTRLTHTLEVSQISRTVARALRMNEDLTEAIALGHDLGHTPFGHAGEGALNGLCPGGFKHYEQSVRVLSVLEKGGKGLNLTEEVLNGILCHTKGPEAFTAEGRIVRLCDKIAYINHDIEDSVRAGIIKIEDLPKEFTDACGFQYSERINSMVMSVVNNSFQGEIKMSEQMQKIFQNVHKFMYSSVYLNKRSFSDDEKVPFVIESLYKYFINNIDKIPQYLREIADRETPERAVCDYIAGMTDSFAADIFKEIFLPKSV